ncbi:MAG: DUF3108 domain-containing protein [Rudaea sp.]|nr:DUF3108 domain-containing protein [Rudaea sp.]
MFFRGIATTTILLLACAGMAFAADAPLQSFHADYQVLRNGKEIGHATLDLRPAANGDWDFASQTHGTAGMASLLGLDVVEKSTFRWDAGKPRGLHYNYAQKAAIKSRDTTIDFDWATKTASTNDNGKAASVALDAPAMDRHLVTLALMADLKSGATDLDYRVVEKDKVSDQHYVPSSHETLALAGVNIDAIKIERDRGGDSKRSTTSWFAPQRGFLPVQIEQVEKNGETITMRLTTGQH